MEAFKQEITNFDIIINATSLGLKNGDDFDFDFENVKNNLYILIQFIIQLKTKIIKILKEKNIKTFNGLICLFIKVKNLSIYGIK